MLPLPASVSETLNPVIDRFVASFTDGALDTVFTGASFIGLTVMATVSLSVSKPPAPVLPPSLVLMVNVSLPLKFCVPRYTTAFAPASVALMAVSVPVRVTVPLPLSVIPADVSPLAMLFATVMVP